MHASCHLTFHTRFSSVEGRVDSNRKRLRNALRSYSNLWQSYYHQAKTRPSLVEDVIRPPYLWSTSGPLSCGFRFANLTWDILVTLPNHR